MRLSTRRPAKKAAFLEDSFPEVKHVIGGSDIKFSVTSEAMYNTPLPKNNHKGHSSFFVLVVASVPDGKDAHEFSPLRQVEDPPRSDHLLLIRSETK